MKKTSLQLDIHPELKIRAAELPEEVREFLVRQLGRFAVEVKAGPDAAPIILRRQDDNEALRGNLADFRDNSNGFWISEYKGSPAIVFIYRGEPDIVVTLDEFMTIHVPDRAGCAGKVYGVLLVCINLYLFTLNAMLFYGAAAQKGEQTILLTGPSGSKKSMLLLSMLNQGWDYISDDKFILINGRACLFQTVLHILDHHFGTLPWLVDLLPDKVRLRRWAGLKKSLRTFCRKYLPSYLLPAVKRFYETMVLVEVDTIFKECEVISSAKPTVIVLLGRGKELRTDLLSRAEALAEMVFIQELMFEEFSGLLKNLAHFTYRGKPGSGIRKYDYAAVVDSNLHDQVFIKLTMPEQVDIKQVFGKLLSSLPSDKFSIPPASA